jgi:hypothetical protein
MPFHKYCIIIQKKGRLLESDQEIFNMISKGNVITAIRKRYVSGKLAEGKWQGGKSSMHRKQCRVAHFSV